MVVCTLQEKECLIFRKKIKRKQVKKKREAARWLDNICSYREEITSLFKFSLAEIDITRNGLELEPGKTHMRNKAELFNCDSD